jgi:dUTP pyrophosphatase
MKTTYIARPIDRAGGAEVTSIIRTVVETLKSKVLSESGVMAFDPASAFTIGRKREVTFELQDINNRAIQASDSMLVFAPAEVKSWGVPAEVQMAVGRGMNVAIVTDGPVTWAMPQGRRVKYFEVKPVQGGSGGWMEAGVAGLSWLADQPLPKFTNNGRDASSRTAITFAPVAGADPKDLHLPTRAYSDDAGLDLYTAKGMWLPAHGFTDIPTHLRVQLPDWSWGFLVGRSSTLRKRGLLVNPGIIDTGYRGELFIGVQNLTSKPVYVEEGDRLAQLIVIGNATRRVVPSMEDDLDPHARGHNGFGSSGN